MKQVKILAIDDNNDNLVVLKALINEAFPEADFIAANSGSEGIRLGLSERPDVILTDVVMPGIDGYEVCKTFKENELTHTIPVIMITALRTSKENRIKALEAGADAFLAKPIDEQELTAQIRAMVRIKESEDHKIDEKERLEKLVEERTNELLHSQAQLKGIFENLQDAYFQADLSGIFTLVSPSALKMYGYRSINELIGRPAEQLYFNPKERDSLISILRTEGQIKDYVSQGRKSDGSAFWVSMNIQWLWSKDRQIIGTEGVVRDITERNNVEMALKESEERFKHVFESANVGKSMTLPNGEINVNQAFCDMLGYTKEELKNKKWQDITPFEEIESTQKITNSLLKGEKNSARFNKRYLHKNGSFVWADVSVALLRDQQGKPLHFITTVVDITERKAAEELLLMSEEKHRTLFEQASDGIFIADNMGNYMDVNSSGCKMLGYSREEILKFNIRDLVTADSLAKNELKLNELRSGGILIAKRELRCKDGSLLPVEISGKMLPDGRYQGIVRDITERIETEKALKESEEKYRLMVDLLPDAVVIHEGEQLVFANAAALKIAGADSFDKLIERPLMDYVHPDFRDISLSRIKEIYSTGQPSTFSEEKFITLKDEIIDVEVIGIPVMYLGKPAIQTIIRNITERKKAELAIKKSEAQFREFFEKAADAIFIAEIESGIIVDANEAAFRLMLRPHDELVGIHQTELHPPILKDYSKDTFKEQNEKVKNNLTSKAIENSVVRADGIEVPVEILASEVDYQGKRCMMGTFRDITQRKKAEDLLRESEIRSRSTFEQSPVGSVIVGLDKRFIKCNAAFCRFLGYTEDELIGKTISEITYPDDIELGILDLKLMAEGKKESSTVQKRYVRKDGIIVWGEVSISLVRDKDNKPMYFLPVIQDINERMQAEMHLNASKKRYQTILQTAMDGYWIVNTQGQFTEVNETYCSMSGYSEQELLSMRISDVEADEMPDHVAAHIQSIMSKGEDRFESRHRRKDGTIFNVEISVQYQFIDNGLMVVFIKDITERKITEEALKNFFSLTEATLESIHNGILVVDHEGKVIKTSSQFVEMWHIPDEILATGDDKTLMNFILDQLVDPVEFVAKVMELYSNPDAESTDLVYFKDGRIFERVSKPMHLIGKPKGRVWSFFDITERMKAEVELRESQSLYHSLIEQLPNPVFRKDREGRFVLVNSQFCRMKGLASNHFIGLTVSEVAANEMAVQGEQGSVTKYFAQGEDIHNQILQTGKIFENEEEYILSNGNKQYLQVFRMPVVDSLNNIIGTQGIMFDITERKLAEEARKESYKFNQSLLKTIPFGMNIVDEYGNILFQNEKFENVFGKDAIGGKCWELYRDDKSQCDDCPLHKGIEVGETAVYESNGVLGGRIFEISHTGMMFKGRKAMLEIFQDITERKQVEEEIRTTKKLLEQTFEQSPVPMVLVSMPDMMIRIVNPACRTFLGIEDEASVINTPLAEIKPTWQDYDVNGKQTDFEDIPLPKSLIGKQTIGEERQIVCKDGTIRNA